MNVLTALSPSPTPLTLLKVYLMPYVSPSLLVVSNQATRIFSVAFAAPLPYPPFPIHLRMGAAS